jgi:hypothetical protein
MQRGLSYEYEFLKELNPDCSLKFLEKLKYPQFRGLPYEFYQLFQDEPILEKFPVFFNPSLFSVFIYAPFPNKLTIGFLKYAIDNGIIEIDRKTEICKIKLAKEIKEQLKKNAIKFTQEEKQNAILKSQELYFEIVKNGKLEYYQDTKNEFFRTFHKNYLEELFMPTHFPFLKNYKYLVIGDDEAKGLFLWEIFKGDIDLTISDIDEDIIRKYRELGVKAKFKAIDTRHYRNSVWERFDVVISYSLLNPSLSTIKEFLLGTVKDYGIAYISWYPSLYSSISAFLDILNFWYFNGFWITHITPYFLRMVKIPELPSILSNF